MIRNKKAITMVFKIAAGLIFGIFLFFFFLNMIGLYYETRDDNGLQSVITLAEEIRLVTEGELYETRSSLLTLPEDAGVFLFNPKWDEPNGRFGDGDIHLISQKDGTITSGNELVGSKYTLSEHILRPSVCDAKQACICYCSDVSQEKTLISYQKTLDVSDTKPTPYPEKAKEGSLLDTKHFVYNQPSSKEAETYKHQNAESHTLYCAKNIECQELGEIKFISPLNYNYFIGTNSIGSPFTPHKAFENGFYLQRNMPISKVQKDLQGGESLPKSIPIIITKTMKGELAACLTNACIEDIQKDIDFSESQATSSSEENEELTEE